MLNAVPIDTAAKSASECAFKGFFSQFSEWRTSHSCRVDCGAGSIFGYRRGGSEAMAFTIQ